MYIYTCYSIILWDYVYYYYGTGLELRLCTSRQGVRAANISGLKFHCVCIVRSLTDSIVVFQLNYAFLQGKVAYLLQNLYRANDRNRIALNGNCFYTIILYYVWRKYLQRHISPLLRLSGFWCLEMDVYGQRKDLESFCRYIVISWKFDLSHT